MIQYPWLPDRQGRGDDRINDRLVPLTGTDITVDLPAFKESMLTNYCTALRNSHGLYR